MDMEKERLIPRPDDQREKEVNRRPKSASPLITDHDTNSSAISRRPATAHAVSMASDVLTIKSEDERRSVQIERVDEVESSTKLGDDKVIITDLRGSKVDEGWREESGVTDGNKRGNTVKFKYNTSTLVADGHGPEVDPEPPKYTVNYSSIRHLIELTEGETDLDSDKEIPDIFSKADQQQHYTEISGLKDGLIGKEIHPYLEEFSGNVQQEQLIVGKMSLEQVEAEEQQLQTEYLAYQEQEANKQRERQTQIATSEEKAKKEVQRTLRKRRKDLLKKEAQIVQSSMTEKKRVYKAYNKAEQNMKVALKARKGEIKALYGDLERTRGYYGAVKGRRWKVDWTKAPQPVQIKIKTLRGTRDKLPASRYLLLVSLHDRLGGHVLRWSKLKGQQWGAATMPVEHQGHFYNTEIKFEQSVYTVLPSKPNVSPSMILVFELFILRGPASPTDQVVGWGVFPVCDAEFNIIEGKYKCPFLRGPIDPLITKHSKVEGLLSSDLENWLSNLYFEVIKLPRYLQGMHEYEVELQFTSSLLGQPDRTHDENDVVDGNEPVLGTESDMFSLNGDIRPLLSPPHLSSESTSIAGEIDTTQLTTDVTRTGLTSRLSRRFQSGYAGDSDSESSTDDESTERSNHLTHEEEGFMAVEGKYGLFYKVHEFNPFAKQQREIQTLLPHSSVLEENRVRKRWARKKKPKSKLSYENELKQHTISIHPPFSNNGRVKRKIHERLQYLGRQFASEMGLSQWRNLEFWSMSVIFILCWWIRLYLHYIAQYGFLRLSNIPVSRFEFYPHTVLLHYQSSLLSTREEVAIVILGPFFNTFIFCCFILLSWLFQKVFVSFPDLGSLFIAAFGVQVVLDPYWILVVDMALLRFNAPRPDLPTGDITKLYWHFVRLEGNGVVGIFLVLFLYVFTTFVTLACYYMYFLRVHMNGKLIDIYHRLKSTEDKFFLPQDLELSNEELGYISRKAEQWRGADGERRKVAVHDYIWEERKDGEQERRIKRKHKKRRHRNEVTTHISIYTLHLDGFRELYRHFLRLDDGAIVEIFGDISSVAGISTKINHDTANSIQHSLTSFDHSETTLKDGGSSSFGDLSRIPFPPVPNQTTPTRSLNEPDRESFISVSEHEQDSNHYETTANFEHRQMEYVSHDSLGVPEQTLSSPYNRHTGVEYHSSYSKLSTHGEALEVSLSIPDLPDSHSEVSVSEDTSYSVRFKSEYNADVCEQDEGVEYCSDISGQETHINVNSKHVEATPHNMAVRSERQSVQEKLEVDSPRGKASLEKKLSAGQLV